MMATELATASEVKCEKCGADTVDVSFGPYGFLATCNECGWSEHMDDMLEPLGF